MIAMAALNLDSVKSTCEDAPKQNSWEARNRMTRACVGKVLAASSLFLRGLGWFLDGIYQCSKDHPRGVFCAAKALIIVGRAEALSGVITSATVNCEPPTPTTTSPTE